MKKYSFKSVLFLIIVLAISFTEFTSCKKDKSTTSACTLQKKIVNNISNSIVSVDTVSIEYDNKNFIIRDIDLSSDTFNTISYTYSLYNYTYNQQFGTRFQPLAYQGYSGSMTTSTDGYITKDIRQYNNATADVDTTTYTYNADGYLIKRTITSISTIPSKNKSTVLERYYNNGNTVYTITTTKDRYGNITTRDSMTYEHTADLLNSTSNYFPYQLQGKADKNQINKKNTYRTSYAGTPLIEVTDFAYTLSNNLITHYEIKVTNALTNEIKYIYKEDNLYKCN